MHLPPLSPKVPTAAPGEALRTGMISGTVEAITPVIGWAAGRAASGYIAAFDHWIAFSLLAATGSKMIWDSMRRPDGDFTQRLPTRNFANGRAEDPPPYTG